MRPANIFLVLFVVLGSVLGWLALQPKDGPYGLGDMVPVGSMSGEVHGEALLDDLHSMSSGGDPAEVYDDGELVGHMTLDGFVPLDEAVDVEPRGRTP